MKHTIKVPSGSGKTHIVEEQIRNQCEHEEFEDNYCLYCGKFVGGIFDLSDYYNDMLEGK